MPPSPSFLRQLGLLSLPCLLSSSFATAAEAPTNLFNGHNLAGWQIQHDGHFTVEGGVIKVDRGTGWLRSDREYADFTLTLEVRFLEPQANSGIFVRTGSTSHDDEKGYPDNGYQVQCMDTAEGQYPIGAVIPYGAGEFEQVFDRAVIAGALKPTGEWNALEITCQGEHLAVRLNGTLIVLVQGIRQPSGHIGLQGELGALEFRHIELAELGP